MQPSPSSSPPPPPPRRLPRPSSLHRDAGAPPPPKLGLPRPSSFREQSTTPAHQPPGPPLRRVSTFATRPESMPSSSSTSSLAGAADADRPRLRRGPSFAAGLPDPSAFETPPLPRLRRGSSFAGPPPSRRSPTAFSPSSSSSSAQSGSQHRLSQQPPPPARSTLERTTSIDTAAIANARRLSASKPGAPPPPGTFLRRSKNHATHTNLRLARPEGAQNAPVSHRLSSASSGALPRAGTFAYGAAGAARAPLPQQQHDRIVSTHVRRASSASTDRGDREKRVCGMCGNCNGVGPKGMPPWAPERLKLLSESEREAVMDEMRAKEEVGKLEAEARKKRVADMRAVGRRLEHRRSSTLGLGDDEGGAARGRRASPQASAKATTDVPVVEMEASARDGRAWKTESEVGAADDAESGDERADGAARTKSARRRRSRAGGGGMMGVDEFAEERAMAEREARKLDEDCGLCDGLEHKVGDLEEQLAMLKEVVKLCADNEEAARKLDADKGDGKNSKKNKTWMDKIANAYYGNPAAAVERTRLKEEVDVLKKASDFLFEKLQTTGTSADAK